MAGCAVLIVLAHLLLAQLTLGLALVFTVTGRVSRWRLWWLTAPAAAGLAWTLAIGPGRAGAGFAAGPAHVLGYLAGPAPGRRDSSRPPGPFAGAGSWLAGQLPIALIAGAAEAALIGWLDWLQTDESAIPPRRPGLVAAVRAALAGCAYPVRVRRHQGRLRARGRAAQPAPWWNCAGPRSRAGSWWRAPSTRR